MSRIRCTEGISTRFVSTEYILLELGFPFATVIGGGISRRRFLAKASVAVLVPFILEDAVPLIFFVIAEDFSRVTILPLLLKAGSPSSVFGGARPFGECDSWINPTTILRGANFFLPLLLAGCFFLKTSFDRGEVCVGD